jgi:hypothetical protein
MDTPFAIQQFLAHDAGVQAAVRQGFSWPTNGANGPVNGVFLMELDEAMDSVMPIECVLVRAAGGAGGYLTLQLNDQRLVTYSYGATMHLAWNLDGAVYSALKNLTPSVWAKTYLHNVHPAQRGNELREPNLQWPYILSIWQVRASDLTIAA